MRASAQPKDQTRFLMIAFAMFMSLHCCNKLAIGLCVESSYSFDSIRRTEGARREAKEKSCKDSPPQHPNNKLRRWRDSIPIASLSFQQNLWPFGELLRNRNNNSSLENRIFQLDARSRPERTKVATSNSGPERPK